MALPAKLGKPVTSRQFSWKEMVVRQWGTEWSAPDHRVYVWSNGRAFDSTDMGSTGIYQRPGASSGTGPSPPPPGGPFLLTESGQIIETEGGTPLIP